MAKSKYLIHSRKGSFALLAQKNSSYFEILRIQI